MKKYLPLLAIPLLLFTFYLVTGKKVLSKKPDLAIFSSFNSSDPLNKQAINIAQMLHRDLKISFLPLDIRTHDIPKDLQKIAGKPNKVGPVVLFSESVWAPHKHHYTKIFPMDKSSHIFLAYSTFYGTKIPKTWATVFNSYFDGIIVPDQSSIPVYRKAGVTIPIFELPPIIKNFTALLNAPLKQQRGSPFLFSSFGECTERSNQIQIVRAFAKEFGNREDVLLKLYYPSGDKEVISAIQQEIAAQNLYNVVFIQTSDAKLKLLQEADCYVSLAKSECFPADCLEAAALGTPVIMLQSNIAPEFTKSSAIRSIKAAIPEKAYLHPLQPIGEVYNCSVEDASLAMQDVYTNYGNYLSSAQSRRTLAEQYDLASLQERYYNLFKPVKVVLGEKEEIHTKHLMTQSKELYEKYQSLVVQH